MKQLRKMIEEYLEVIGRLEPVKLGLGKKPTGPGEDEESITKKGNLILSRKLGDRAKSNRLSVAIAIAFLCISFVALVFLLPTYGANTTAIKVAPAIIFLVTLGVVVMLRRLWFEKNIVDVSLIMLQQLPSNQAADFISVLYWALIRQTSKHQNR